MNFATIIHDAQTGATVFSLDSRPGSNDWPEIAQAMAAQYGCQPSEIDCTNDGSITAIGVIVAYTH